MSRSKFSKYVLIGSKSPLSSYFIHRAFEANILVFCVSPLHTQYHPRQIQSSPITDLPEGSAIKWNVWADGSKEQLRSILKDAKGVIWAADPDIDRLRLGESHLRYRQYLEDLDMALNEMDPRSTFLCVTYNTPPSRKEVLETGLPKIPRSLDGVPTAMLSLHQTILEQLDMIASRKGLKWTVVRVGNYLETSAPVKPETGIELGAGPADGAYKDDIAKMMIEILKVDGLDQKILDVQSVAPTKTNQPPEVIRRLSSSPTEQIPLRSVTPGIRPPFPSTHFVEVLPREVFSGAHSFLSNINPKNFPKQFEKLQKEKDSGQEAILELLREIRKERIENEDKIDIERQREEEIRKAREIARLETLRNGLPPDGVQAEVLRWSLSNVRTSKQHVRDRLKAMSPVIRAVRKPSTEQSPPEPEMNMPKSLRDIPQTEKASLLDLLTELLEERSAPMPSMQVANGNGSDEDFHPRWLYSGWRTRLNNRDRR